MVVAAGVETQEYTYLSFEARKALIRSDCRIRRRPRAGHGRHHPSVVPHRDRARARGRKTRRGSAAAVGAAAAVRGSADAARSSGLFRCDRSRDPTAADAYLNPGPGAEVSIPDTIALAKLPRVQFIKESSRDLARVSRLIVEIDRAGHAQYFTTMQMLLASLELGGSGATMPPPAAEIARHVIEAFVAKDHERAAQLQLQFALFPSKWMHYGLGPTMKAAMNLIGVPLASHIRPMRHCRAMTWRRSGPTSKAPCWRRAWRRPPQPDWDACPFRKKNPPAAHGNIGGSFMIALVRTRRSGATMTLRFLRLS